MNEEDVEKSQTRKWLYRERPKELGYVKDEHGKDIVDKKTGKRRIASFATTTAERMNITDLTRGKFEVPEKYNYFRKLFECMVNDFRSQVGVYYCYAIHGRPKKIRRLAFEFDFENTEAFETEEEMKFYADIVRQVLLVFFPAGQWVLIPSFTVNRTIEKPADQYGNRTVIYKSAMHLTFKDLRDDETKTYGTNVEQMERIHPSVTKALEEASPRKSPQKNEWKSANDPNIIHNGLRFNLNFKASACKKCRNDYKERDTCYVCAGYGVIRAKRCYDAGGWVMNSDGTFNEQLAQLYAQDKVQMLLDTSLVAPGGLLREDYFLPEGAPLLVRSHGTPTTTSSSSSSRNIKCSEENELTKDEWKTFGKHAGRIRVDPQSDVFKAVQRMVQQSTHTMYKNANVVVLYRYEHKSGTPSYYKAQTDCTYCLNKQGSHSNRVYFLIKPPKRQQPHISIFQHCHSPDQHDGVPCNKFQSPPFVVPQETDIVLLFPYWKKRGTEKQAVKSLHEFTMSYQERHHSNNDQNQHTTDENKASAFWNKQHEMALVKLQQSALNLQQSSTSHQSTLNLSSTGQLNLKQSIASHQSTLKQSSTSQLNLNPKSIASQPNLKQSSASQPNLKQSSASSNLMQSSKVATVSFINGQSQVVMTRKRPLLAWSDNFGGGPLAKKQKTTTAGVQN
jgi:hypothetical protein